MKLFNNFRGVVDFHFGGGHSHRRYQEEEYYVNHHPHSHRYSQEPSGGGTGNVLMDMWQGIKNLCHNLFGGLFGGKDEAPAQPAPCEQERNYVPASNSRESVQNQVFLGLHEKIMDNEAITRPTQVAKARFMLGKHDLDHDGHLNKSELKDLFEELKLTNIALDSNGSVSASAVQAYEQYSKDVEQKAKQLK